MNETIKLYDDVNLHFINTNKYKTNIIAVFLTTKLSRDNITKEALIPAVLRLGTKDITNQKELNKKLEEMYGANFNCGIEKKGDNHILKFYIESINDDYAIEKEEVLNKSIEFLFQVILNPLLFNDSFDKAYVDGEKENLKRIIESRIDNKTTYAYSRCIEEMFKDSPYGLYEYGYIEDLKEINEKNLYEYYRELVEKCKIDIYLSGNIKNENAVKKMIYETISGKYELKIRDRKAVIATNSKITSWKEKKEQTLEEKMDITQGKLIIGLGIENNGGKEAAVSVYNAILGGGANSKLFQNVREKANLAYSAGSGYLKTKNVIVIRCGIEVENYAKALDIIKKQLEDMKEGKFEEKDINDAKELIIGSLKSIKDEQANEISYEFSNELNDNKVSIDEYINQVRNVSKQEIVDIASDIKINTIYFLKN